MQTDWWSKCGLLVAPCADGTHSARFAVVGPAGSAGSPDRVTELVARLQRIAAEIIAAGISAGQADQNVQLEFPELELTTRQRQILSRLLEGDRVPTIAAFLCVSQSTVLNHLAAIFSKLDIHSQSELLHIVRGRSNGHPQRGRHRPESRSR
jgi:DNA-binding NarL/FixJ family response regulator